MRRALQLLVVGALGASLLVAAGCGGSNVAAPQPLNDLQAVAAASRSADSVAFDLVIRQSALGQELEISADGAFDNVAQRARMRLDLSSFAKLLAGFGKAFGGGQTTMPEGFDDPAAWKLEVIQDGTKVYLHFPLLAPQLGGKEWVGGDLRELARTAGADLGQIGSLASSDPRSALDALKAVSGPLEAVGRESVDGTETTHYRGTLDPAKIAAQAQANGVTGDLLSGLRQALAQANLDAVPIDVWVDDQGLLRKYVLDVSLEQGGQQATVGVELRLHDYGQPVEIDLPAPSDVADAATLAR